MEARKPAQTASENAAPSGDSQSSPTSIPSSPTSQASEADIQQAKKHAARLGKKFGVPIQVVRDPSQFESERARKRALDEGRLIESYVLDGQVVINFDGIARVARERGITTQLLGGYFRLKCSTKIARGDRTLDLGVPFFADEKLGILPALKFVVLAGAKLFLHCLDISLAGRGSSACA
jgi:hypothetical protein